MNIDHFKATYDANSMEDRWFAPQTIQGGKIAVYAFCDKKSGRWSWRFEPIQ